MGIYFSEARNIELSLLYFLESTVPNDWSGIAIVKTFKSAYAKDIDLPIICCRLADTSTTRLEIGGDTLNNRYLMILDVFCRSDAQRLDLGYYIKNKLKEGWVHYDHSHKVGDKSQLERTANGRDFVTDWIMDSKIDFGESGDTKDKYRHNISIRIRKSS